MAVTGPYLGHIPRFMPRREARLGNILATMLAVRCQLPYNVTIEIEEPFSLRDPVFFGQFDAFPISVQGNRAGTQTSLRGWW